MRRFRLREHGRMSGDDSREYKVEAASPQEALEKLNRETRLRVGVRDYRVLEEVAILRLEPGTVVRTIYGEGRA